MPVDGIERRGRVDQDAPLGQELLVDAQAHEHAVVELRRLVGGGGDGDVSYNFV